MQHSRFNSWHNPTFIKAYKIHLKSNKFQISQQINIAEMCLSRALCARLIFVMLVIRDAQIINTKFIFRKKLFLFQYETRLSSLF